MGINFITNFGFYFPTLSFFANIFASFLSQFNILKSNMPIL